jgi:serine protease AprX
MVFPRCPLCHQVVHHLITTYRGSAERSVIRKLASRNPDWDSAVGLCERCLFLNEYDTVAEHFAEVRSGSLFRLRLRNEFALLPTPLRMDADPRATGRGVTIAFIDSGFYPHPDMLRPRKRILAIVDVTDEEKSAHYFTAPHPESWHGTMTSVTAAGSGHLSRGLYRGIASDARVVLIKVMDTRTGRISSANIERGIRWVIDHREEYSIGIISISVGGDGTEMVSPGPLHEAVETAVRQGIIVVAAGGNSPDHDPVPPASSPFAITVGGLDDRNQLRREFHTLYHSSYRRTPEGVHKPEIIAPAIWVAGPILPGTDQFRESRALFRLLHSSPRTTTQIIRKYRQDLPELPASGDLRAWARRIIVEREYVHPAFKSMDGTSLAAPIVTSIIAQMLEVNPRLAPHQVREILLRSAVPLEHAHRDQQGSGTPSARAVVRAALEASAPERYYGVKVETQHTHPFAFFFLHHPSARSVALAGEFNNWNSEDAPLFERSPGEWVRCMKLPGRGTFAYKYVVNGHEWVTDPSNEHRAPDGHGGFNSTLTA